MYSIYQIKITIFLERHYNDLTRASWDGKSLETEMFVQPIQPIIEEFIDVPHYWPFCRGIRKWPEKYKKHLSLTCGKSYSGLTRPLLWMLLSWFLASPGHQQPWYWLLILSRSFPYTGKNLKYLRHFNVEEYIYIFVYLCVCVCVCYEKCHIN